MRKFVIFCLLAVMLLLPAQSFRNSKSSTPYVGEVIMMANNYAPEGFIPCDGRLLNIMDYQLLYIIIGNYYGGDGSTTFAVPDLRSRVPIGTGQGFGLSYRPLGQKSGTEYETISQAELAEHSHYITGEAVLKANSGKGNSQNSSGASFARAESDVYSDQSPNAEMAVGSITMDGSVSTGSTGSGLPHNNIMPYVVINYYIAYQGTYPSRSKENNNEGVTNE